jgi:cell division cycle 14
LLLQNVVVAANILTIGRANAACLLACYMVLIQQWPPHLALAPIAQIDPPVMPFRDAGYSQADYALAIQDVVYGVWKAKKEGLCGLREFSLEEYVPNSISDEN